MIKALSIKQPWADLILGGGAEMTNRPADRKTIEVRTWRRNYRGLVLIHAPKTLDPSAMNRFCVTGESVTGAYLGIVILVDIIQFNKNNWKELRPLHQNWTTLNPFYDFFGWVLEKAMRFEEPIPGKGRQGLYKVPGEIIERLDGKQLYGLDDVHPYGLDLKT